MNYKNMHKWNLSPARAKEIQLELAYKVIRKNEIGEVNFVAGIDVGFDLKQKISKAAVAVLSYPGLKLVEYSKAELQTVFPYIPGLLSFREVPVIIEALNKLKQIPDVVLCDGQGIAHPRRFGLACHIGVLFKIPSIGVAKSRLVGEYRFLDQEKGSMVPLTDQDEIIGSVIRSRINVKPLFISIGHKINMDKSLEIVWNCITKYRLPETTRWAHRLASL
ncbi:MAG: deoxyribonuclease V [Calditrichaceae bacterium]|nr:deoxyribonuclease V [Calditrichaceae bacterium]